MHDVLFANQNALDRKDLLQVVTLSGYGPMSDLSRVVGRQVRWRLTATRAKVYSVWTPAAEDAAAPYYRFQTL